MADIMLEDGSGVPQPYENVETLEVDNTEGGTETFVHESLIPEAYIHPATHPASMITELSKVATGGRFADLWHKPFGELPRLDETELTFTRDIEEFECLSNTLPGSWEDVLGETFKITWDGTEYTCMCKDVSESGEVNISGILYMGNFTKFFGFGWGTDTGEPFVIGIDVNGINTYGNARIMTTDPAATHTVSITPVNSIKKLDEKYLPDVAATKQWVREFAEEALADLDISGGSGGTAVTETEILPEQEFSFTSDDPSNVDSKFFHGVMGESELLTKLLNIKVGKHYTVVLDGVEYNCTALDATVMGGVPAGATVNGLALLGNVSLSDVDGAENTGEPFWIQAADIVVPNDNGTSTTTKMAAIVIKPGIAAESVTRTVRIYQKADLKVAWDNVTDKPFYESINEDILVPEQTIPFGYDPAVDSTAYLYSFIPTDEMLALWESDWSYAEAVWDGVKYTCEPQYYMGMKGIGNEGLVTGVDNGTPFVMLVVPAGAMSENPVAIIYSLYDPFEGVTEETTAEDGTVTTTTTYPTLYHTGGVTLHTINVHKIDDKYQHQSDWNENDESSAAYIKNRPFGDAIPSGTVLIDRTVTYDSEDFGLVLVDTDTGESYIKTELVIDGATYIVDINGHIYRGEYVDENTILSILDASDVTCSGGILLYDTAENLVGLLCIKFFDAISFIWDLNGAFGLTHMESYPVKIAVWDATKKIDQKYLPYGVDYTPGEKITSFEATNLSAIDDSASAAAALSTIGLNAFLYICPSDSQWTENKCTIGETYALNIGDEIIYAEAKSVDNDLGLYFGNPSIMAEIAALQGDTSTSTLPDTGEDYLIVSNNTDGIPNGGFQMYFRTNYGDSVPITIYSVTKKITPIERDYIPGPPEFDLTAMGLPAVTLDGQYVTVETDTSAIRTAAAKGLVKTTLILGNVEIESISTLAYITAADIYSSTSMAVLSNLPYVIEVIVSDTTIMARAIQLAVPTTT